LGEYVNRVSFISKETNIQKHHSGRGVLELRNLAVRVFPVQCVTIATGCKKQNTKV